MLFDRSGNRLAKFCREIKRFPGEGWELESKPLFVSDFEDLSATG